MPDPIISEHFTYAEMTRTGSGLPNEPDTEALDNLQRLAGDVLEPARALLGPLSVNSGFRSKLVNAAVGSKAKHSAHLDGRAADVEPRINLDRAFAMLIASDIQYDQAIREPGWLHLSIAPAGTKPRRQALIAYGKPGALAYKLA